MRWIMRNSEKVHCFMLFVVSFSLSGCGLMQLSRMGVTTSYSIIGDRTIAEKRIEGFQNIMSSKELVTTAFADESSYADRFRANERGNLVGQYTPSDFTLTFIDVNALCVYNKVGNTYTYSPLLGTLQVTETQTYSLKYSRGFIRDFTLMNGSIYQGFGIQTTSGVNFYDPLGERTKVGNPDDFGATMIVVDLGPEYSGILLEGEIPHSKLDHYMKYDSSLHYFTFNDLIPYRHPTYEQKCDKFMIGSDIEKTCSIVESGLANTLPFAGPVLGKPGPYLDFSGFVNPEVILFWDLQDLLEIYDHNTPGDNTDDVVSFRLSDPLPIDFFIQEADYLQNPSPSDTTPPNEIQFISKVWHPAGTVNFVQHYPDCVKLFWINPYDMDYKQTTVIRKADSQPSGYTDGEVVYSGYRPMYTDDTGVPGTHYYYLIYTEDYSGNKSQGIVTDIVFPHDGESSIL